MQIFKTKYKRYKILQKENKTYIIDIGKNKIGWLLPPIIWFLPQNLYLCKDDLKSSDLIVEKNKAKPYVMLVSGAAIATSRILTKIAEGFKLDISHKVTILIILLIILITIGIKIYDEGKAREMLGLKFKDVHVQGSFKFKLSRETIKYLTIIVVVQLMILIFWMVWIYINIIDSNFLFLLCFTFLNYMLINFAHTLNPPESAEYKIFRKGD